MHHFLPTVCWCWALRRRNSSKKKKSRSEAGEEKKPARFLPEQLSHFFGTRFLSKLSGSILCTRAVNGIVIWIFEVLLAKKGPPSLSLLHSPVISEEGESSNASGVTYFLICWRSNNLSFSFSHKFASTPTTLSNHVDDSAAQKFHPSWQAGQDKQQQPPRRFSSQQKRQLTNKCPRASPQSHGSRN